MFLFGFEGFLVLIKHSFFFFTFISACLMVSASSIPKYFLFPFSLDVLIFFFFDLAVLFFPVIFPTFARLF